MSIVTICSSFIAALLGLAYPLALQVLARIEDKYKSAKINTFLRSEVSWKLYRWFLFISLTLILLYVLRNIPFFDLSVKVGLIVSYVLVIALISTTVITIVSFIIFADKLLVYQSFARLSQYLIILDRKAQPLGQYQYFEGLTDILAVTIRESNIPIAREISEYCYKIYHQYIESQKGEPVEYPTPYYNMILRATEELALSKERGMPFLEVRTVGGLWLIGEMRDHTIHENTFSCIWRAQNIALKFQRDDFIMHYWERADLHITYKLSPRLVQGFNNKMKEHRERFLEFHYALGGLLLYKERYTLIGRFFRFTRSQPPHRDLLPLHMSEIFRVFFTIRDPYDREFMKIQARYPFPELEGIYSDDTIKHWISKYLAVLFIRQFSIVPHLITQKPLDPPILPDTQQERKMWIENIRYFKRLVEEQFGNDKVLAPCHLDHITDDWCKKNGKLTPVKYIDDLLTKLQSAYDHAIVEQEVSEEKKRLFYQYSGEKLVSTMEMYDIINNKVDFEADYKDWFIDGGRAIIDKSSFAENQDFDSVDYHSFLADSISDKYKIGVSELFYSNATYRYLIKPEDIKVAIEKLDVNVKEYIIVVFGINDHYYKNLVPTYTDESKLTFGLKTILFTHCNFALLSESIFVISKTNLPNITHLEIEEESIEKYGMESLKGDRNIFASVTDLFQNKKIRSELADEQPEEGLKQSVYLLISTNTRFRWKKDMNMAVLKIHSEYGDKGTPLDVENINPILKPK